MKTHFPFSVLIYELHKFYYTKSAVKQFLSHYSNITLIKLVKLMLLVNKLTEVFPPFHACHMLHVSRDHLEPDKPHQVPYICTTRNHLSKRKGFKTRGKEACIGCKMDLIFNQII